MTDFLPDGYQTPEIPSNYMTLEEGQNSFRVLSSAIVGYKWWIEKGEEGRRPVRVPRGSAGRGRGGCGRPRSEPDRKSTRLNSSHRLTSRMPSSA